MGLRTERLVFIASALVVVVSCSCGGNVAASTNADAVADACPEGHYRDADGDGVGAGPVLTGCAPEGSGFSTVGGDCDDDDARAFPGQADPQEGLRSNGSGDFDCDGVEVKMAKGGRCGFPCIWEPYTPPCGMRVEMATDCSMIGHVECQKETETVTQRCL